MLKISLWLKMAAVCVALVLAGCGGAGSSSVPPAGGIVVTPGNGQVTVTWQADAGVEYWLMYAPTAAAIDIKNPPANHVWATKISSPYVLTGLVNGTTYSFAMNGRTGGGQGGTQTASVSATPRYAGSNWVAGTGAAGALRGVSYGTSTADSLAYFVAVGDGGAVYKAADGVSQSVSGYGWSAIAPIANIDFHAATYALGKFIAVGATTGIGANNVFYSSDASTWSGVAAGSTALNAVASDGTKLVAVGDSGTVFYSTDAANWTAANTTGVTTNLVGVAYSATLGWAAVAQDGALITSSDGMAWTLRTAMQIPGPHPLHGLTASSGGIFVAVGENGTVMRSVDGVTWQSQSLGATTKLNAVSTDSVQFVAVGVGGNVYTSLDGVTWAQALNPSTSAELFGVLGSVSKYVAVGLSGTTISSLN